MTSSQASIELRDVLRCQFLDGGSDARFVDDPHVSSGDTVDVESDTAEGMAAITSERGARTIGSVLKD